MFLGLDAGTSAVKALLVDRDQRVVAQASRSYPIARPEPGWSEQDPNDWIAAVEGAIGVLRAEQPAAVAAVEAIGLSGQMHSAVLLGEDMAVLRPAMLWNDARGRAECAALARDVPGLAMITGVQPMPGFTAAKLLWIRGHQPEIFARDRPRAPRQGLRPPPPDRRARLRHVGRRRHPALRPGPTPLVAGGARRRRHRGGSHAAPP